MKIDTRELLERLSTSRREFNATAFAELDRNLSDEEREEWNAIYASFSSRSLLRNTVVGLESIPFPTDEDAEQELTCMVVMRHLVKVLIPLPLFWLEPTGINPNSVIGAEIDYIIIGVDREGECAVAARSLALEQQRWHALNVQRISGGDVVSASVLACGPTRITVTACGFDVTMGQLCTQSYCAGTGQSQTGRAFPCADTEVHQFACTGKFVRQDRKEYLRHHAPLFAAGRNARLSAA